MTNNIKIIQDISLLYELSLSVGTTLDPRENCHNFLRTLISRKSLNFGAVWLHRTNPAGESYCDLFYIHPHFRQEATTVSCSHYILQKLAQKSYLSISSQEPGFESVMHEKKIATGSYAIFNLGGLGFLKLFASNRLDGFPEAEMEQLKQVVDKLKVSLDGCFAHIKLKEETESRMLAQQALEESEFKLRRIIDSSLDAVVSVDSDGNTIEWNLQAERMFGYQREEALGKHLPELIIPERHREFYQNAFKAQMQSNTGAIVNKRYEIKCLKKNGQEFPAELSISANIHSNGLLVVGFLRDITEQRKSKIEIERARTRLENLITNLHAGILLEDSNRRVVLSNQAFCDMFYVPVQPAMLVGGDCIAAAEQSKSLFADPEKFMRDIHRTVQAKKLVESEILLMANGRILERDYIPLFSGEQYDGHLWQYRDITERQHAEQAIRDSEEKYRGILENMDLGLIEVDLNETIVRVNNAFCQMMGYTPEELLKKNSLDLIVPKTAHDFMQARNIERQAGISSVYELQLRKKDGSYVWGLISGAPIKNAQGQVIGSMGIQFDLTDRKNLENALAEAKQIADRARTAERQFLTHMSHEIRTPINALIGMTHLLFDTNPTPTQNEYLHGLRFSADSLLGIVDNILDLSKIDAGEIEFEQRPFDLEYLVKSLTQSFQFKTEEKGVKIYEKFDPAISNLVVGDPTRTNQILTNLLGNSIKFTERGQITVAITLLDKRAGNYRIEFRISDTGIGIQADKLDTIFEYFKQADAQINRKFGGTGLGLTIVKQLVEMLGGEIHVESQFGIGTDFVFTLDFGDSGTLVPTQKLLRESGEVSQHSINGFYFLIVEDNLLNQKLLCKTLESWNCRYEVANNGMEALHKSAEIPFDAILMDIHMPGLDGFETTLAIRNDARNPNQQVPIIALTAAAMLEDKRKSFEVGMNGFLTKPIAPKMLQEHLLRAIPPRPAGTTDRPSSNQGPSYQFDLSYLMEMSQGDNHFVRQMLDTFIAETPKALQEIETATQNKDLPLLCKLLHTLKPNFAIMGLKSLQEQTAALEAAIKAGEYPAEKVHLPLIHLSNLIRNELALMAAHVDVQFPRYTT